MGGLYTALTIFQASVMLISCDMPMIRSEHLRYLLRHADQSYQAIVAAGPNGIEPLFAIYQMTSLSILETSIESGDYALYKFINKLKVKFVDFSKTSNNSYLFFNINTFSDYKKVLYLKKKNQD